MLGSWDRCGRRCRWCIRPCKAPSRSWRRRRWSGKCRARDWGRRDGPARRRRAGSGLCGSTSMLAIIWESRRPRCVQVLPGVGGFVDAVAGGEIGPDDAGAAADVDDVGVGRGYRDGADRSRWVAGRRAASRWSRSRWSARRRRYRSRCRRRWAGWARRRGRARGRREAGRWSASASPNRAANRAFAR